VPLSDEQRREAVGLLAELLIDAALKREGVVWSRPASALPCPADRSLVAEDRNAAGVRDQTGPEPPMLTRLLTGRATTPRDERIQDGTTLRRPPSVKAW
jgi:hypothetical protein